MRRILAAALALVAIAGCTAAQPADEGDRPDFAQLALTDAATAAAGGDAVVAGAGILMALDRGYAFTDVLAAIESGLFEPFYGFIREPVNGNPVPPSGSDTRAIIDKPGIGLEALALNGAVLPIGGGPARLGASTSQGGVLLATLLDSIGSSFGAINFGAKTVDELLAQPQARDREVLNRWSGLTEQQTRDRLAVVAIMGLAASGYSPEQIVWAIVSGTKVRCLPFGNVEGTPCSIAGEVAALPALAATPPAALPEEGPTPSADARGVWRGSAELTFSDFGGETVLSVAQFTIDGDLLSGSVEFASQENVYSDGSYHVSCQYILLSFEEFPLTATAPQTYSGMMTVYRPERILDQECGSSFTGSGGYSFDREATFTVDGDVLSGSTEISGWAISATRQ